MDLSIGRHTKSNRISSVAAVEQTAMARVVQLFQTVRKCLDNFVIRLNLPTQANHQRSKLSFSGKTFLLLIFPAQLFISSVAFILIQAQTVDEYGVSFYMTLAVLVSTINISNTAWKVDQMSTLLDKYEEFVDKR